MSNLIDYSGHRFGKLVVLKQTKSCKSGASWLCKCDCGTETIVSSCHLKSGHTSSCGCLKKESHNQIHGLSKSNIYKSTYKTWKEMRQRCNNNKNDKWKWYGGKGISVCKRWDSFALFVEDMGIRPNGLTIDRINNDGNYSPDNCRWTTHLEQTRKQDKNKLNLELVERLRNDYKFQKGFITDAARKYNVSKTTMSRAIHGGTWQSPNPKGKE